MTLREALISFQKQFLVTLTMNLRHNRFLHKPVIFSGEGSVDDSPGGPLWQMAQVGKGIHLKQFYGGNKSICAVLSSAQSIALFEFFFLRNSLLERR